MGWFSNFKERVRGWVMSILPVQDIFKQMGVEPQVSASMPSLIERWRNAYQGVPSYLKEDDKTIGFPTTICWDLAKKSVGELEVVPTLPGGVDEETQAVLDETLTPFIRGQVEYALALGGVVARPWYDGNKVQVGWYTADMVLPTVWDGKKLTGVVLIDRIVQKEQKRKIHITKLESIQPVDEGWVIETKLYKSNEEAKLGTNIPITSVPQWAEIDPFVLIKSDTCPFVYMATPWANNQDFNSPQGTSIFRDAMGVIEELDRVYTSLCWEIEAGKTKIFIDDSMVMVDPKTGRDKMDQLEKKIYRKVSSTEGKDLLEPHSPTLRVTDLNAALKTQLSIACMACHLDAGAYVYDQASNAITATEVRSKQQQTYGTIVDIQDQMIEPFIRAFVDTVRSLQNLYELEAIPEEVEIGIDFGDSVLTDEETDRTNAQAEVTTGLRSKQSYLMEYRGMTEEQALQEIERIKAETPVFTGFFDAGA